MTYKGAALMEWAHGKANEYLERQGNVPLSVLVAEAYLYGATDALADETRLKVAAQRALDAVEPLEPEPKLV